MKTIFSSHRKINNFYYFNVTFCPENFACKNYKMISIYLYYFKILAIITFHKLLLKTVKYSFWMGFCKKIFFKRNRYANGSNY